MNVTATLVADDGTGMVTFDAGPYLRQASDDDLDLLIACGLRGDYPADDVAHATADRDPDVAALLQRCQNEDLGFEVRLLADETYNLLLAERPGAILRRILGHLNDRNLTGDPQPLSTLTVDTVQHTARVAFAHDNGSDEDVAQAAVSLIYLLVLLADPESTISGLPGQIDRLDTCTEQEQERAALYARAGVSLSDMLTWENDPTRTPDTAALETLAALRGHEHAPGQH